MFGIFSHQGNTNYKGFLIPSQPVTSATTKTRNVDERVGKGALTHAWRSADCSTAALSGGLSRTEIQLLHGQLWSRAS